MRHKRRPLQVVIAYLGIDNLGSPFRWPEQSCVPDRSDDQPDMILPMVGHELIT
jgi:hypothetical protein